jgi:hypothetical protein
MAQAKTRIMPFSHMGLSSTPKLVGPQKANSNYKQGAPVIVDANGYVASPSTTASTGVGGKLTVVTQATKITGFVDQDGAASASKTSDVGVHRAQEGMEFVGHLISATSPSSNAKVAQTDLGARYPLAKHASDTHWGICKQTASIVSVANVVSGRVTRLIDDTSTVNGRVAFEIPGSYVSLGA